MQTFLRGKRVGYWLSEKKVKKLNFLAFADMCRNGECAGKRERRVGKKRRDQNNVNTVSSERLSVPG
ncbi:inositol-tetrakisphosphate 1-kinase [Tachysurus ichikawai]